MWQSVQILSVFNSLTLKLISWKMNTFFKKLEYRFLVESTKIENASSPCKPGISEAIVKRNKMLTIIWTYQKERSFANNYFIFWKFCFSLRTSYAELICCTNNPNDHYCTFCKRWSFIWRCFFAVHCVKSVQIRSNFFFRIFPHSDWMRNVSLRVQSEYGKIRTRNYSGFGHFSRSGGYP